MIISFFLTIFATNTKRRQMKKSLLLIILWLSAIVVQAQRMTVNGTVTDESSGTTIAYATVTVPGSHRSVVTNSDGFFTLKVDELPPAIVVSHVGYKTRRVDMSQSGATGLHIKLTPATVMLNEVMVWTTDPEKLVHEAIKRIPQNYSKVPELYQGFYRETAMKRQRFIYIAEGVVDMHKNSYRYDASYDRVAIAKGRRLLSQSAADTLGVKVMGGPILPVQLDVVKNADYPLNEKEMGHYRYQMELPATINDRLQFVVSMSPRVTLPYPLFSGKLYIDYETLAFTRVELSLDVSDKVKATEYMLVRKPTGVRFKPKELSFLIDYRYEDGVTHLSYVRSTFRFNCDWKRRLFATSFTAVCEMVVTNKTDQDVHPISGRQSFDSRDAFYDKVDYFLDPNFWEDYNIIEPTETLDKAIGRLLKRQVR